MKNYNNTKAKLTLNWLCFGLYFIVSACGSPNSQSIKDKEAAGFIKFYAKTVLKNDSIILLNTLPTQSLKNCLFKIMLKPEYNKFNKSDFLVSLDTAVLWNDKNKPENTSLIQSTDVPSFRIPKEWHNFRKKNGGGYYAMSYPIVSNDLNYIIFYCEYNCGDRCGYGRLGLYKKTVKGWELVKYYCDWTS